MVSNSRLLIIKVVPPPLLPRGGTLNGAILKSLEKNLDEGQRRYLASFSARSAQFSRALARLALARFLPPGSLIKTDASDLPYATEAALSFSHPDGAAFACLSRSGPIGVDAEKIRPSKATDLADWARRFCSSATKITSEDALRAWTVFEAVYKLARPKNAGPLAKKIFPAVLAAKTDSIPFNGLRVRWRTLVFDAWIVAVAAFATPPRPSLICLDGRDLL